VPTKKEKLPLSATHPELAKEADGWDARKVTLGSKGKFNWKCPRGHKYESLLTSRTSKTRPSGCPYCANRRVLKGFNDVASTHPEIAQEANGWDPSDVIAGSHKKYSFKCDNNHTYETTIGSRTGKGNSGCPYCANQKVWVGFNDLATTSPDLAKEADGWDPTTVITGSNKKLSWVCSLGHRYAAAVSSRMGSAKSNRKGTNCPVCINQKILIGYNDLSTTHPELSGEVEGWDPTTVVAGTSLKRKWRCSKSHVYETGVSLRALRGYGCPVCTNKQVLVGFNDLKTTDPVIAASVFEWDPETVTRGSDKKKRWSCEKGHVYEAPPMARTGVGKSGCPYCAHQKILAGFNDLATTNPEAAKEADGWDPSEFIGGNRAIKDWKCSKGHSYRLSIYRRDRAQVGCPICGNRQVLEGYNDLATTHPELASEADGWDPKTVMAGSELKFKWKCISGHKYSSALYSRAYGNGCPICANRIVVAGVNDLSTTHPSIASEADGWDPSTVSYGNETKQQWICPLNHKYAISPNSRTSKLSGCPICANQLLLTGFNDLATKYPEIAVEAEGWDPTKFIAGSRKRQMWKCSEGHTFFASLDSRTSKSTGCPTCTKYGYDPNKDGWLYFMEHEGFGYLQIGITNNPEDRLKVHFKLGWELLQLRGPMDGHLTANWETSILRMLRAKGAQMGPGKSDINKIWNTDSKAFVGTEMWLKESFQANSINELMRLTEQFEE
jgi:hypothetical protein